MGFGSNEHFYNMAVATNLSILHCLSQDTPLWTRKSGLFTDPRLAIHREYCQLVKHTYLSGPCLYPKENKNRKAIFNMKNIGFFIATLLNQLKSSFTSYVCIMESRLLTISFPCYVLTAYNVASLAI